MCGNTPDARHAPLLKRFEGDRAAGSFYIHPSQGKRFGDATAGVHKHQAECADIIVLPPRAAVGAPAPPRKAQAVRTDAVFSWMQGGGRRFTPGGGLRGVTQPGTGAEVSPVRL